MNEDHARVESTRINDLASLAGTARPFQPNRLGIAPDREQDLFLRLKLAVDPLEPGDFIWYVCMASSLASARDRIAFRSTVGASWLRHVAAGASRAPSAPASGLILDSAPSTGCESGRPLSADDSFSRPSTAGWARRGELWLPGHAARATPGTARDVPARHGSCRRIRRTRRSRRGCEPRAGSAVVGELMSRLVETSLPSPAGSSFRLGDRLGTCLAGRMLST